MLKKAKTFELRKIMRRITDAKKAAEGGGGGGEAAAASAAKLDLGKLQAQLEAVKQADLDALAKQVCSMVGAGCYKRDTVWGCSWLWGTESCAHAVACLASMWCS